MRSKQEQMSYLKYKLHELEQRKIPSVCWELSTQQVSYIQDSLHYVLIPRLYWIRTKCLKGYKDLPAILKEQHRACKAGKKVIRLKLSSQDRKLLDEYHVKYGEAKYEIILRRKSR